MIEFVSKHLASAEYDEESLRMRVDFRDGSSYEYFAVDRATYEDFANTEAPDVYFRTFIKHQFEYVQVQ